MPFRAIVTYHMYVSRSSRMTELIFAAPDKERFLHFYGEPGARLDRSDSAFKASVRRPRPWWFRILSFFFFFMPLVYMNEFDSLYVDDSVHYHFWRQFMSALKRDWDNSITPVSLPNNAHQYDDAHHFARPLFCYRQMLGS